MELLPFVTGRPEGVRRFRLQLGVLIAMYTVVVYAGIYVLSRTLAYDSLRSDAGSYYDLVIDMRQWNASHGGVWVAKSRGVESNPYLAELGINPDITSEDGAVLTMRNPSVMTSEISELTRARTGVSFHLTSLEYLNPENAPDAWERTALLAFDRGVSQRFGVATLGGVRYYRYSAPLAVDDSCLTCHGSQGYKRGDVRGAVTVSIPMAETDASLRRAASFLGTLTVLTIVMAITVMQLLLNRMEHKIDTANRELKQMALTDALTGILNRGAVLARLEQEYERAIRTGMPISVLMLDLDHFKRVNDTMGHAVGDCALQTFTTRVQHSVRGYDAVGRVGGEEFLVIAPGTGPDTAYELAERIRASVAATPFSCAGEFPVTVSVGVATLHPGDTGSDSLLARADNALYAAKNAGRNRVEVAADPVDET
ncbi:MAG: diguanylate cyclase [Actinobacteria bacterium HGW-Actinobacteria-10]|jgi:diguanylate cyclase (GGDEF)-like protein|nr:MAG: diguanylate cyclase [Actinobacteria bacterium HGW-Actinobacteria-10]